MFVNSEQTYYTNLLQQPGTNIGIFEIVCVLWEAVGYKNRNKQRFELKSSISSMIHQGKTNIVSSTLLSFKRYCKTNLWYKSPQICVVNLFGTDKLFGITLHSSYTNVLILPVKIILCGDFHDWLLELKSESILDLACADTGWAHTAGDLKRDRQGCPCATFRA